MAAETHAYTADFLSQFPRADHTSSTKGQIDGMRSRSGSQMNALGEKSGGGSWDESLGRQREYYAHREACAIISSVIVLYAPLTGRFEQHPAPDPRTERQAGSRSSRRSRTDH